MKERKRERGGKNRGEEKMSENEPNILCRNPRREPEPP